MKDIKKTEKMLYIWLLAQPFIDLFTSLDVRFEILPISIGIITRMLFLVAISLYLILVCEKKYRLRNFIYLALCGVYFVIFTVTKMYNNSMIFVEISSIVKFFYFPIVFLGLHFYFKEIDIDYKKLVNVYVANLFVMAILLLIPLVTNTSFASYTHNPELGSVGWFYAANETGAIMILLFPFFFLRNYTRIESKMRFVLYVLFIVVSYLTSSLGTKVAFLGMIITSLCFLVYAVVAQMSSGKKQANVRRFAAFLLVVCLISPLSPAAKNIRMTIQRMLGFEIESGNPTAALLSNRDLYLKRNWKVFSNSDTIDQLFGIGFTVEESDGSTELRKTVEIDAFDLFLSGGVVGTVLFFLPFVYIFIDKFKRIKLKNILRIRVFTFTIAFGLGFAVSFFAGHVFSAPGVSTYMAIILVGMVDFFTKEYDVVSPKTEC